jgi:hypothetical protein
MLYAAIQPQEPIQGSSQVRIPIPPLFLLTRHRISFFLGRFGVVRVGCRLVSSVISSRHRRRPYVTSIPGETTSLLHISTTTVVFHPSGIHPLGDLFPLQPSRTKTGKLIFCLPPNSLAIQPCPGDIAWLSGAYLEVRPGDRFF